MHIKCTQAVVKIVVKFNFNSCQILTYKRILIVLTSKWEGGKMFLLLNHRMFILAVLHYTPHVLRKPPKIAENDLKQTTVKKPSRQQHKLFIYSHNHVCSWLKSSLALQWKMHVNDLKFKHEGMWRKMLARIFRFLIQNSEAQLISETSSPLRTTAKPCRGIGHLFVKGLKSNHKSLMIFC